MTTISEYQEITQLPIETDLPDKIIPLCGVFYHRHFVGHGAWNNFTYKLVSETGEVVEPEMLEEHQSIHSELFDESVTRQKIADLFGVPANMILFSDEDAEYEPKEYKGLVAIARWRFFYLSVDDFVRMRKEKKVSVLVELDTGHSITRWMAPKQVRVRNASFNFDPETPIKFVATHQNSFEYVTEDGVKVFDNRNAQIGFCSGGLHMDGQETQPVILREDALRDFLYAIWRGHRAKQFEDSERERFRDYAGWALHRLALDTKIPVEEGRIVADGIKLLYGSEYVPAEELLGYGFTRNFSKRMLFKDTSVEEGLMTDVLGEDPELEVRYVVVKDD